MLSPEFRPQNSQNSTCRHSSLHWESPQRISSAEIAEVRHNQLVGLMSRMHASIRPFRCSSGIANITFTLIGPTS